MTRTAANEVRREVAKILGSSTAFIVVVVVLVVVIIVSCTAIIYLLREDRRLGGPEARLRRRYNAQPLVDRDLSNPLHPSRKWYSYLWGSRDRHNHNHTRLDKSTTMMEPSGEGGSGSREWDVDDIPENRALRSTEGDQSGPLALGMSEHESSASSFVGQRVYAHRMHSLTTSDRDGASSVLRYDPHDVRGLPYPDQFSILPQVTIPRNTSIQSQLNSPTFSSRSSPVPRQTMKSPEPISNTPPPSSHDSDHDSVRDSQPQFAPPVLRTAGSGTKFFESL